MGIPIPPPLPTGKIHLSYQGYWALTDWKIKITVNGNFFGAYSFKKPFNIIIPVEHDKMQLRAVLSGIRTADIEIVNAKYQNIYLTLDYNRMWGSIDFIRIQT